MTGSLWILSYVILFVAVACSLAVSFAVAAQLGRMTPELSEHEVDPHTSLLKETPFPDLVISTMAGSELRPAKWTHLVLIQSVIRDQDDVEVMNGLRALIPERFHDLTLVSAIGDPHLIEEVSLSVAPIRVVHDRNRHVEAAIRTRFRPHVILVENGLVSATRTIESPEDLREFVVGWLDGASSESLTPIESGDD